jgi:hypothetical protein
VLEDSTLIEFAKKNCQRLGHTQVSQPAIHMKRIQIVLQGLSHRLRHPPDQRASTTAGLLVTLVMLRRVCQKEWQDFSFDFKQIGGRALKD